MLGRERLRVGALVAAVTAVAVAVLAAGVSAQATAGAPAWAKTFARYVGVKRLGPANAKLAPVTVGWVNDQGGIVQSPESTQALDAAVKVVNTYLGGVGGGHPLVVKKCFVVQQESQGQKCAQQFLNDPSVKFVLEGFLQFGSTGFHQTNAGKKPVLGTTPLSNASASAKNTFELTSGLFGTDPGEISYVAQILHGKTVSLLYPQDDPAGVTAAKLFQQIAAAAKLKVTAVGFSSTANDLLTPLTASGATSSDATVVFFVSPSVCQAGAKATQQLGVKRVVAIATCLDPAVKKGLGDYPKWTYVSDVTSSSLPKADKYVAAWLPAISQLVPGNPAVYGPFAQVTFGQVLTAAKLVNRIGYAKLTPASFSAKLKRYRGPAMFGPPNLRWGSVPGLPTLGTTAVRLYTYEGGGKWADATGGKWLGGR